ncbi:hypothetical protein [Roseateles paludis]|jgi:hypothetical protein|uniref:Siderophore-interacting protein n=1 Tax=Roseateles paludis TaxID=3145238 RepID=A0ABV0FWI4_9BURK
MGREANCHACVGAERADAKALLESTELILRGAIKRRWPLSALEAVRVEGDALCFNVGPELVTLQLGSPEAGKWADRIAAPPKSLAAKLGLAPERPAWVLGTVADAALADALAGHTAPTPAAATQWLAVLEEAAELPALLSRLQGPQSEAVPALWAVYPKGGAMDAAVRTQLRAAGWRDVKACAVSERLTATRYLPPAAA